MRRFVLATATAVALVGIPQLASADKPVVTSFQFSDSIIDTSLCGFPVTLSFEGEFIRRDFFDHDGNLVRIEAHAPDVVTATSSSGKTFTGHEVINIHVNFRSSVPTESKTGIPLHFNGLLVEAGRHFFDETGETITGRHQVLEGDVAKFCSALL